MNLAAAVTAQTTSENVKTDCTNKATVGITSVFIFRVCFKKRKLVKTDYCVIIFMELQKEDIH